MNDIADNKGKGDKTPVFEAVLAACILLAAFCQIGIGAQFSESGEQIGLALPVSSVVLGVAFLLLLARSWPPPAPVLAGWQITFLSLACVGLLGMSKGQVAGAVKELFQLAEIVVVSAYVFHRLLRPEMKDIRNILAALCPILLVLGAVGLHLRFPLELSDAKYSAFIIMAFPFLIAFVYDLPAGLSRLLLVLTSLSVGITFQNGGLLIVWMMTTLVSSYRSARASLCMGVLCVLAAGAGSMVPRHQMPGPWQTLNPKFDRTHTRRTFIEAAAAPRAPLRYPLGGGLGCYKRTINQLKQHGTLVPHPYDEKVPRDGNTQYLVTMVEAGLPAAVALIIMLLSASRMADVALSTSLFGVFAAGFFCTFMSRGTGIWVGALLGLAYRLSFRGTKVIWWVRLLVPTAAAAAGLYVMLFVNISTHTLRETSVANRLMRRALYLDRTSDMCVPVIILPDDFVFSSRQGTILVEAESFSTKTIPFIKIQSNEASGREALAIPENAGKGEGEALYTVYVPEDGTYLLFARVRWRNGCSNSLGFTFGTLSVGISSELYERWHVLDARRRIPLKKGWINVKLRNLEDGIQLDYWGLRGQPDAAPRAEPVSQYDKGPQHLRRGRG